MKHNLIFFGTRYIRVWGGKRKHGEKGTTSVQKQKKKETRSLKERLLELTVYTCLALLRVAYILSPFLVLAWSATSFTSLFMTHRSILSFSLALSFLIHSATPFPFPFFGNRARHHAYRYITKVHPRSKVWDIYYFIIFCEI